MCCMPLKPLNKCFRAATTKKTPFFAGKWQKKCQNLAQISVFWVWVVSLCPPIPYFEGAGLKKRCVACHGSHLPSVSGPPPRKNTIFRGKMATKKCQFWAQIRVFWVWVVNSCPCYPILRVLNSKKDVLHAIEAIAHVFQGRHHEKKTFFAGKWPKNANF